MCWQARQLRGRGGHSALLSLKVGGSSLTPCLHKNYYLGGRWGGVSLALLCWYFICYFCLLHSLLLVCCRLSKGNKFYLLFLREILKSGLLRLTTWCDILSCSHYLEFLVSGHHRFDDLIDKERKWTLSRIVASVWVKQRQKNKTSKTLIPVEDKDCSCNCEQEYGGWRDHLELILPRLCFCAVSQVQS